MSGKNTTYCKVSLKQLEWMPLTIDFVAKAREHGVGKWDGMKKALGFGADEEFFEEWIPVTSRWTANDKNHTLGFLKEVSTTFNQYVGYVDLTKMFFSQELLESYGCDCGEDEQGMDVDKDMKEVLPVFEQLSDYMLGLFRIEYLALVNITSLWGEQQISEQDQRKRYHR